MSVMAVNNTTASSAQPAPTSLVASGPHALRNPTPGTSRPSTPNMPMSSKSSIPFSRMMSTVEYKNLRFIILDCPTEANLPLYKEEFRSRKATDVVRVCEPTYNKAYFEENGIRVHDWPFKDGGVPPATLIQSFLSLCDERFGGILAQKSSANGAVSGGEAEEQSQSPAIAVHCVAGLGRAPILVAICLVESGMEPLDAVEFIRRRRRGALNSVQLQWLVDTYKRTWHKTSRLGGISVGTGTSSSNKYGFLKRSGSPTGTQTPPQSVAGASGEDHGAATTSSGVTAVGLKEKVGKVFRFGSSKKASSMSVSGSPNLGGGPTTDSSAPSSAGSEVEKTSGAAPGSTIAV
ncbi:protein-tyrosine phosphatase-like protein [Cladochytrium replicatum]|nr:protein-tyrosine phosphatase-like protein [Cladochytrium replicatum]